MPPGLYPQSQQPPIPKGPTPAFSQISSNSIAQAQPINLPYAENKFPLVVGDISLKRTSNGWQLWAGQRLLRDFGDHETDARDALRVYRDLRATEWVTIGTGKPVVEYGLVNGQIPLSGMAPGVQEQPQAQTASSFGENRPIVTGAGAKQIIPIDLGTVRVEAVRGVWCLRDDFNIHLNFGVNRPDAEQALAVVRKYGFNRVGIVGQPVPAMTYFFAVSDMGLSMLKGPLAQMALQAQIDGMTKVGIPVAGLGYVGEMVRFDPRTVTVRKDGGDWLVVAGYEVLGRFGPGEWIARDAARSIQDAHFTEFCTVGSAGLTFFLENGRTPTRVPFNAQGRQFDLNSLKVRNYNERWAVTENGRPLIECANAEEGETLIRLLQYYQFNQLCHLGPTPKLGVSFLAKAR